MRSGRSWSVHSCFTSCVLQSSHSHTHQRTTATAGRLSRLRRRTGAEAFSVHGKTTVDTWTSGQVQVSITGIEEAAPNRNITIVIYPMLPMSGWRFRSMTRAPGRWSGIYETVLRQHTLFRAVHGNRRRHYFDNLTMGTNTISGPLVSSQDGPRTVQW